MTDSPFARRLVPLLVDAVLVVVFAALGARTHHEGSLTAADVADVAWPFLAALGVAHAFVRLPSSLRAGLGIWLTTLVGGMLLRRATGDGTATAFVVVATTFTLATLLGWRVVVWFVARRRADEQGGGQGGEQGGEQGDQQGDQQGGDPGAQSLET